MRASSSSEVRSAIAKVAGRAGPGLKYPASSISLVYGVLYTLASACRILGEGFAIFLQEKPDVVPNGIALWFQVDDVDATHAAWSARGVRFTHGPQKNFWGYGPELADPDGYLIRLWDARSMKEK